MMSRSAENIRACHEDAVPCFFDERSQSFSALALCSGLTFSTYVLLMEYWEIREMWFLRTALYNVVFSVILGVLIHGEIILPLKLVDSALVGTAFS